jgi:hypothetical protein
MKKTHHLLYTLGNNKLSIKKIMKLEIKIDKEIVDFCKLNELDLWPWFILFDIWSIFYYLFTLPSVWKAPQKNWN